MQSHNLINFAIGCVGAMAPEVWRLYNLRTQPVFKWSWGYLFFSIPFILLGGLVAWMLEPTTKYAAFYSGLTTPTLLTTALKDSAKAQKELKELENENEKLADRVRSLEEFMPGTEQTVPSKWTTNFSSEARSLTISNMAKQFLRGL